MTVQFSYLLGDLIREYLYARKQELNKSQEDVENTVESKSECE